MPHKISVGELLVSGKTSWPQTCEYNYYHNGHELRLFYATPTEKEVEGVKKGECEFAFLADGPVIFVMYRFGQAPWSDTPYSWHLVPDDMKPAMPTSPQTAETRAILSVILVDALTGIVKALRAVTFSPHFTHLLHAAIAAQASTPWVGRKAYDEHLAACYRKWPTATSMLRDARERTRGGA